MKDIKAYRSPAKKIIAAVLTIPLLLFATEAFGQGKKGATILVALKDGSRTGGELIAVRSNSIILLDSSGKDLSLGLTDIDEVRVVRRSKAGQGALLGLFAGGIGGYAGGSVYAKSEGLCPGCEAPMARAGFAILGATVGVVTGLVVGAGAGQDRVIRFDAPSGSASTTALARLRPYARVRAAAAGPFYSLR